VARPSRRLRNLVENLGALLLAQLLEQQKLVQQANRLGGILTVPLRTPRSAAAVEQQKPCSRPRPARLEPAAAKEFPGPCARAYPELATQQRLGVPLEGRRLTAQAVHSAPWESRRRGRFGVKPDAPMTMSSNPFGYLGRLWIKSGHSERLNRFPISAKRRLAIGIANCPLSATQRHIGGRGLVVSRKACDLSV